MAAANNAFPRAAMRFADINPYAGHRARLIFWAGPTISFFLMAVVARIPLPGAVGFAALGLSVSAAMRLRWRWDHLG